MNWKQLIWEDNAIFKCSWKNTFRLELDLVSSYQSSYMTSIYVRLA